MNTFIVFLMTYFDPWIWHILYSQLWDLFFKPWGLLNI